MKMIKTDNFQQLEITKTEQLRIWLAENHSQKESIWLVTFKKSEGSHYVSRWEVLDELICFGWFDGIRRKLDDKRTMQLISPRKAEHWARTYKDRAANMIREERMAEPGFRSIEISKENGLWDFMEDVDNLIIPEDLHEALNKNSGAYQFFNSLNDSSKRFALRWLKLSKTEKTRKNRIEKLFMLSKNQEKLSGS